MVRRSAAWVMMAVGALFITVTFTNHLFSVGPAFDRMSADFRPIMTSQEIATYRGDINNLSAAVSELQTKAMPAIATQLGMTPQAFNAFMGQQFPAVANGLQIVPSATQQFGGVIDVLDNERARFTQADQIPTNWLPAKTIPWTLLFVGIALILAGWATLRGVINGLRFALALAVLLVVLPFGMSLPSKASSADTMNKNLEPVYTQQLITGANASLATLGAMGTEMQAKMLPALAQSLHMSGSQLQGFLATNFPTVAAELAVMPATMTRFGALVSTFSDRLGDYNTLKPVSFVPIVWMIIGGGLVVTIFTGWAFVRPREKEVKLPVQVSKAA